MGLNHCKYDEVGSVARAHKKNVVRMSTLNKSVYDSANKVNNAELTVSWSVRYQSN